MSYYTIPQIINISKAAQVITSKWIQQGVLWNNGALDPMRPYLIYFVRKTVEYYYNHDQNFDGLYNVALYLFGLCPVEAIGYVVDGGNVTPVNPPAMPYPQPIEFDVDSSTFFANGDTTKTLPTTWAGFQIMIFRNNLEQRLLTTDPTYYSYNPNTRTIIISPAAVTTEPFSIRAV